MFELLAKCVQASVVYLIGEAASRIFVASLTTPVDGPVVQMPSFAAFLGTATRPQSAGSTWSPISAIGEKKRASTCADL